MITITPKHAKNLIAEFAASDTPASVMLWGLPGVGKTSAVAQAAQELGIGFKSVVAHLYMPSDVLGLPFIIRGETRYAPPELFPDARPVEQGGDGERGLFFLDELPNCVQAMQSAWGIVILERSVRNYKFPRGWTIVCAGNPPGTMSASNRLIGPLQSRVIGCMVVPEGQEFYEYAVARGLSKYVTDFLDFKKDALLKYDTTSRGDGAFPNPRSWERVSEILQMPWPRMQMRERNEEIKGQIGVGMATEFLAYLDIYASMPTFDDIINDRMDYTKSGLGVSYAVVGSLLGFLIEQPSQQNVNRVMALTVRMPSEYRTLLLHRMWNYGKDKSKGQAGLFVPFMMGSPFWSAASAHLQGLIKAEQQ